MSNALYSVAAGQKPYAQDLDQLIQTLTGTLDPGAVSLSGPVSSPGAPSVTLATGSLTGAYSWVAWWVTGNISGTGTVTVNGTTPAGTATSTQSLASQEAIVSAPSSPPPQAIGWGLGRTLAGGSTYYVVTTAYLPYIGGTWPQITDDTPDSSLTAAVPTANTTGSPFVANAGLTIPSGQSIAGAGSLNLGGAGVFGGTITAAGGTIDGNFTVDGSFNVPAAYQASLGVGNGVGQILFNSNSGGSDGAFLEWTPASGMPNILNITGPSDTALATLNLLATTTAMSGAASVVDGISFGAATASIPTPGVHSDGQSESIYVDAASGGAIWLRPDGADDSYSLVGSSSGWTFNNLAVFLAPQSGTSALSSPSTYWQGWTGSAATSVGQYVDGSGYLHWLATGGVGIASLSQTGALALSGGINAAAATFDGAVTLTPTDTATSSNDYDSYVLQLQRSYWDSSTSAAVTGTTALYIDYDGSINIQGESGSTIFFMNQGGGPQFFGTIAATQGMVLSNSVALAAQNTGGASYDIAYIDGSNHIQIGDGSYTLDTYINGKSVTVGTGLLTASGGLSATTGAFSGTLMANGGIAGVSPAYTPGGQEALFNEFTINDVTGAKWRTHNGAYRWNLAQETTTAGTFTDILSIDTGSTAGVGTTTYIRNLVTNQPLQFSDFISYNFDNPVVIANTIGNDGAFVHWNYNAAIGASWSGQNLGGLQFQIDGTAEAADVWHANSNASSVLTSLSREWWSYGLNTQVLSADFVVGSLASAHNTLDDGTGRASFAGALTSLGGQATAGALGVGVVVAEEQAYNVTGTAFNTVLSFTPSATGIYVVVGSFTVGSSDSATGAITLEVTYTDPQGGARTAYFTEALYGGFLNAKALTSADTYPCLPITIYAASGDAISVVYQNTDGGTIDDYVTAAIARIA